jgi:predicted AlkP superfamily phosphohydrolase/phosphomutase
MISEDTIVFLVSDHGFGESDKKILFINEWLGTVKIIKNK